MDHNDEPRDALSLSSSLVTMIDARVTQIRGACRLEPRANCIGTPILLALVLAGFILPPILEGLFDTSNGRQQLPVLSIDRTAFSRLSNAPRPMPFLASADSNL